MWCQRGWTSDVIRSTRQSTRRAVVVFVHLIVGAVYLTQPATAAFRCDGTVPRRVLTHTTRAHSVPLANVHGVKFNGRWW